MTTTSGMFRKTTLALISILLMAASTQAAMILELSGPALLPDTATSFGYTGVSATGLMSFEITGRATAGEVLTGFNDATVVGLFGGLGAHQVNLAVTGGETGTRQDQLNGGPVLWSDTWKDYDSYFYPTSANSLKVGAGDINDGTRLGVGATLPDPDGPGNSPFGPPLTGYAGMSTVGGTAAYEYTLASGLQGASIPIAHIVSKAGDTVRLTVTLRNSQAGAQVVQVFYTTPYIPEPATVSLLGLAMVGGFGFIRRRHA